MNIVLRKDGKPCLPLTSKQLAVVHDDLVAMMNARMNARMKQAELRKFEEDLVAKLEKAGCPVIVKETK